MEYDLSFSEFRLANVERCRISFGGCERWDAAKWMMALIGEVGELANILKKVERGDYRLDEVHGEVAKEIADVQTYLDLLAHNLGVDLGKATVAKFNEVSARVGSEVTL